AAYGFDLFVRGYPFLLIFFFFQAEDGIRDDLVTGVQTCALPIFPVNSVMQGLFDLSTLSIAEVDRVEILRGPFSAIYGGQALGRSEERRVGKECRSRWWAADKKKKVKERNGGYSIVR